MTRRVIEGDLTAAQRAGRLELRVLSDGGRASTFPAEILVLPGYDGPVLPPRMSAVRLELELGRGVHGRLTVGPDWFVFDARDLHAFHHAPALFETLHAPFALRRRERWMVGLLLKVMRWPLGPRLLRAWHARRR